MSIAPMDKDTVIEIIASAVSFIPFCGDYIGNGITVTKGIRKLFKDASKAEQIIAKIQNGVNRGDLCEEDAKSICAALQGILRDKKTDLQKIARDADLRQKLEKDILNASDHRKEAADQYQTYISDTVTCILSPEILPLFADCDQIAVQNLHEIKELLEANGLIYKRLDSIENRINKLEQDGASSSEPNKPDNPEYIKLYNAPLFLDSDNLNISLKNLYVSPKVEGSQADIESVIREWFGNPYAPPCLLLYGAAGIGKTSLVAKLIADAVKNPNAAEAPEAHGYYGKGGNRRRHPCGIIRRSECTCGQAADPGRTG